MMAEAFICDAIRTPFGRYAGTLSSVRPDDLAAFVIRSLMTRHPAVDWAAVDDVLLGCANQAGEDNRNVARMSALLAGLPEAVPAATVNRLCGSGLDAVAMAARAIRCGEADLVIAGGVESMSRAPFVVAKADTAFARNLKFEDTTLGWRFVNPALEARYGVDSMAETAENLVSEYGIARCDQDAFALRSQQRWSAALAAGFLKDEIVPVTVQQGKRGPHALETDEHPRPDSTLEALSALKPIVRMDGTVTAGNSSGLNDGSAVLLIASETAVRRFQLEPKARVVATAVAGVQPRVMGIGPVPATQKLLRHVGHTIDQIDLIELNEAFAAQALAVMRQLGLRDDAAHVNPQGGAIAIGHPLGASGARLVTTATYQLQRTATTFAVCTMCIGVGQGISMLLERVK